MPIKIEVRNPKGKNTPPEYITFPDYFPYTDMENAVREKFPNKYWPDEQPISEEERPVGKGIWDRFVDAGWEAHEQAQEDYAFGTSILKSSSEEATEYLETEYQKWKVDPTDAQKYKILSAEFFGETFGSVARDIGVGISTGLAAGVVTTPFGGIITGGGVVATMQGVTAKGGSIRNTYFGERWKQDQQGSQNIEAAYETARKVSNSDATAAVAEAGAAILIPIPGVGKGLTRVGTKIGNELMFDATIGASGSAISDAYAVAQGVDRGDRWENAFRSGLQEVIGGSVTTGIRGVTEWGRYVTEMRAAQEAIDANEKEIDRMVQEAVEAPLEKKKDIAKKIHKKELQIASTKKKIQDIKEGKTPANQVLSYDWDKPEGEAIFIPQFDENGLLLNTVTATPANIDLLSSQNKVPNIFTDEIFGIDNELGRASFQHENGENYEVFSDGSINPHPIKLEKKVVTNSDGSVDSLNKGGEVSKDFQPPIPSTRSWVEFAEEFGYEHPEPTSIKGDVVRKANDLIMQRLRPTEETFISKFTLEDNDTFNRELLGKHFPKFNLSQYKNELPDKISEGIANKGHVPPFMNRILTDLSLGKIKVEPSENEKTLVIPEMKRVQFHGSENSPIAIPIDGFGYELPSKLSPEGTKTFSEQLRGKDINAIRQAIKARQLEIDDNRIRILTRTKKYEQEYRDLVTAKRGKRITEKTYSKRQAELEKKLGSDFVKETWGIPLPKDNILEVLAPLLSHPEKKEIGPYPHYNDQSKAVPADYRSFARIHDKDRSERARADQPRGRYADIDDEYSTVPFKRLIQGALNDYKQREARITKGGSKVIDPTWKWTDANIKKFIKFFDKEVGRNTLGFRQEGMLTVQEVKDILAGKDPFSDALEGVYYINASIEDHALARLADAITRTEIHHNSDSAESLAQEKRETVQARAEGALDSLALGLHQPNMVDVDNFDYTAFAYQQLKIAQNERDAAERGDSYTPPPVVTTSLLEKAIAQDIMEGKPSEEVGKIKLPFGATKIMLSEIERSKEFYSNHLLLPRFPETIDKSFRGNELEGKEIMFHRNLNGDFKELESRLQNVLKWLWYTDTSKWIGTYTKGERKGKPNPQNIRFQLPDAMLKKVLSIEETGKPQVKPVKYLGKPGDIKSTQYKTIEKHLKTIETYLKKSKKVDFNSVQKSMLSDLQPSFDKNNEVINEFLGLVRDWKGKQKFKMGRGSDFTLQQTQTIRRYMRDILAGFNALGKVQGALYANMFFNPSAIPQIYRGMVGLAAHLHHAGIKNVKEFGKAIGSNVTKAVDMAWNDGVKGIYRTMYNLPWKVIKDIIRLLTPSRETIEKMIPPMLLEWSDSKWDSFYKKHNLEDYLEKNKKGMQLPAVRALLKRNFIDKYHDLASIMARVGTGLQGESLDERLMEIKDSVNAAYKLDALETIIGEKMTELNDFQDRLGQAILDTKIDTLKFADYLKARHAPSRNARIAEINLTMGDYETKPGGSGMSNQRAKEIIDEATREGKLADYNRIATEFIDPLIRRTLDITFESGLITQDEYQRLQTHYEHYIPLRGKEDSDEVIQTTGNGIEVFGPEWQRALGRTSEAPAEQVLPYIYQQYFNAVYRAEKNKVAQSLRQFVIENPNDEIKLGSPDYIRRLTSLTKDQDIVQLVNNPQWYKGKDILALKIEGKNKYLRIRNAALAHELKGTGATGLKEYTRGVGVLTKGLTRLSTQYNPAFILPNFVRDIQYAGHQLSANQSKELSKKVANIMNIPALLSGNRIGKNKKGAINDAFNAIWRHTDPFQRGDNRKTITDPKELEVAQKYDDHLKEMIQYGGRISFYGFNTFESQVKNIRKLSKKVNNANKNKETPTAIQGSKDLISWFKKALEGVNGSFETSTRLAIYSVMRDYGFTPQQAAYSSRNTTINFTRKGRYGSSMNDLYMFFNPGIQGSYNIYKALFHTEAGKKIFFNVFAGGFALEALNQAISGEDEEGISYYDKIPEFKRKHNLVLMNPWTGKQALALPMPYGYNVIHYMGSKAMQVARDGYLRSLGGYSETQTVPNAMRPAEAALHIMSAAANAFNPIGGDSTLAKMVSPDLLDPWIADLPSNRDWKGATIVPEPSPFAPYVNPASERYWQTVGTPFKIIAKNLNKLPIISGGNEVVSGHLDFSPEALEHLTEYYTGGAGKFVVNFYKLLEKMATGKEIIANDVPITRRFVAAPSSHYELEQFKELREISHQATDLFKAYKKAGRHGDAKTHKSLNKVLFQIQGSIKDTESRIRKVNQAIRITTASKKLSYVEKTARIRRLKRLKNDAMRKTHSKFIDLASP